MAEGMSEDAAQRKAARIYNSRHKKKMGAKKRKKKARGYGQLY